MRHELGALVLASIMMAGPARADTPAASVYTQTVGAGQSFPQAVADSTAWFDLGGYCKVVDLGDLSYATPAASGIPAFVPGTAAQWENWRIFATSPTSRYNNQLTLTTCCRPQSNIATLCASAGNPTPVSRQYGRLGEIDSVSAICQGPDGQYTESAQIACNGDNGPDGQASWGQTGGDSDVCTPNAQTLYGVCAAPGNCGAGTQTVEVLNSCGQVQSYVSQACNTGVSCCTPQFTKTGCNGTTATYTDTACGTGSYQEAGGCTPFQCVVGYATCNGSYETYLYPPGCNIATTCYEYTDCGNSWVYFGQQHGTNSQVTYDWVNDWGPPNLSHLFNQNAGPDSIIYYDTCYQ
jgi:hypothetical protein